MEMESEDVLIERHGPVGCLRLNRPKALNALTHAMCSAMLAALEEWRVDPAIEVVMIDHFGGSGFVRGLRGFCAGGDIRMLAASGAGDGTAARAFFREEYRLNHRLFTYAKPIVAFMDGITLGGGVGLALPCTYRVATENTRLAMPETGIGLFPDVGSGWYLSRLPGRIGEYLALSGHRLDGDECVALGLATHGCLSGSLEELKNRIVDSPRGLVPLLEDDDFAEPPEPAAILTHREEIDRLFASDRLEDILAALEDDAGAWARDTLATLRTRSPQTMKVSLRLLHEGATMATFEDELRQEYAVGCRVVQRHDFIEGVRAVIVDKDNVPRWDPPTPGGVTDHVIDQIFAPLSPADEWTPA